MIIETLDKKDKPEILQHLLRLDKEDRYLRFFACLSDTGISNYVGNILDLEEGRGFGFRDRTSGGIIAFAHISRITKIGNRVEAEVGVSVDSSHRGLGLSKQLINRAIIYCKANNVTTLFMSCLRENKAMQHVARSSGLNVVVNADEAYADLTLDLSNPVSNIVQELVHQQISIFDKVFRDNNSFLSSLLPSRT